MEKLNKYLPNELVIVKKSRELARIKCVVQGGVFAMKDSNVKWNRKYSYEISFVDTKKPNTLKLYEEDELGSTQHLRVYS